jgi:hypothetical protein
MLRLKIGLLYLKIKIKNLDDLVDDFNINIKFDYLNDKNISLKQKDTIKS